MKNKRYRELAAILVMMTMTVGSITTVAAETETAAEEETTAETEPAVEATAETETADETETETAENADSEAAETADTQSQAAALEVTDRFAQQTAVDEALLQQTEALREVQMVPLTEHRVQVLILRPQVMEAVMEQSQTPADLPRSSLQTPTRPELFTVTPMAIPL